MFADAHAHATFLLSINARRVLVPHSKIENAIAGALARRSAMSG
jgi:hypothetical protein